METATATDESRTTGKVLIADDDASLRVLAAAALELDGHEVVGAANGEEACRLFNEQPPDLVLLDISMPVVDGYETCTRLRNLTNGKKTPVLMLTGSDDANTAARAFDVGATDFQTKPINWRVLRERIRYMLRAKQDADDLRRLAHYDHLTGLSNRATFRHELDEALLLSQERDELLAVIFLDLDCFKEINDSFGHGFGDKVLELAAKRLTKTLRSGDTAIGQASHRQDPVVGRFGGDEFTILAPDIPDVGAATAIADRIRAAFDSPFHLEGQELFVTVSTGVSVFPFDGTDADTLLKHSDSAMYAAKALGRNNHSLYKPSMSIKASERLALAGELRHAVGHDELRLHFQPKVDVATREIVGAEALIRWQHPERRLLLPAEFMEIAEEIGLGPQIGNWILWSSLSQSEKWRLSDGRPAPVALNISNSQLRDSGLLDRISRAIDACRLDPSCLEVEITEDVIIKNGPAACDLLAGLKALQIKTAIDDFGTGQSALGTLRGLPVDALKIDRSFIRDLTDSRSDRAITASIIDIGHHLGMTVIAEGVETEEQLEILQGMGCDQAQGFLFGKGLPAPEFEAFLRDGTPHLYSRCFSLTARTGDLLA